MKRTGAFIIAWLAGLALVSGVFAADPPKIGYVDMQKALNLCEAGQEAKKFINGEVEKVSKSLEGKQKELNKIRDDLEKRGSVMNETVRREKEKEYQAKLRDLQRLQRDFEEDIRRKDREYTDKVLRDLARIVQTLGEEGKYTLILEPNQATIIYISKGLDLTDEVIRKANAQKTK